MRATLPDISERQTCRVLRVARSTLPQTARTKTSSPKLVEALVTNLQTLIEEHPTYGYRRLWALLRYREGVVVNRKAVYRALRIKQWLVHQRVRTPRPRAQRLRSRSLASNQRWAMDVTHIPCGEDGWGHLTAVIDCHDREIVGYEFALRGRAKEAERALEAACLARFGTLRPEGTPPVLRSDNGLIFQSRRFRQACRDYRLQQEFITPYTPEQNGLIERFFRSLKEECVWQQHFESFEEARQRIANGCAGITRNVRIKRCATEVLVNFGMNKTYRWLDFRGALQSGLRREIIFP
ncbi:MAG: IS3 family transposase [Nitrospirales bacterium]|nr:IS3 family transposase [Nitrospirales bacterium]